MDECTHDVTKITEICQCLEDAYSQDGMHLPHVCLEYFLLITCSFLAHVQVVTLLYKQQYWSLSGSMHTMLLRTAEAAKETGNCACVSNCQCTI